MKRIWKYNIIASIILFFLFVSLLYFGLKNDNIRYLSISKNIALITFIQLVLCVIYSIFKYKSQSFWTFIYLGIIGLLCFIEINLFYGVLSGLLGDM